MVSAMGARITDDIVTVGLDTTLFIESEDIKLQSKAPISRRLQQH